jgi:hypothetical protein
MRSDNVNPTQDTVLASGLITAPAWGSWLAQLHEVLGILTLLVGLALGLSRLWIIFKDRNRQTNR